MLESTVIALKFPEDKLPPLPGEDFTDQEVRAVLALHLEKTQFSDSDKVYEKNLPISLEEMGIQDDETKEKIIAARETLDQFLSILIEKLQEQQLAKVKNEGIHEYYPFMQYIYHDDEDLQWKLDLEKFQDTEAKFDNLLLYDGQFIVMFNPVQTNHKPLKLIVGDQYKVRDYTVSGQAAMMQQLQQQAQQQMGAAAQCTCNAIPCTCGAMAQLGQLSPTPAPDPDDEEESQDDYKVWDELLQEAEDRDVILVYNQGEEIARF